MGKSPNNSLMHFVKYGWKEGRNPSSEFNTQFYLENNNDVQKKYMDIT